MALAAGYAARVESCSSTFITKLFIATQLIGWIGGDLPDQYLLTPIYYSWSFNVEESYTFGDTFQSKLLHLIYVGALAPPLVAPTYFRNPIHTEICESLFTLRDTYADVTPEMLQTHLFQKRVFRDKDYREELEEALPAVYKPIKPSEHTYLYDLAFQFGKLQQYRAFLRQGVDILQQETTETLTELDSLFAQTSFASKSTEDTGDFYFSGLNDRLRRRNNAPKIMKSFIAPLDFCLEGGGFWQEELILCTGLTSVGKSFFLTHIANSALLQMKKTVFFSLEMTTDKIAGRLDAAFSGLLTHDLSKHGEVVERRLTNLGKQFGDTLLLKRMPAGQTSVVDLCGYLDGMRLRGFVPDVLILDYINLMKPHTQSREGRYRDLGQVYIDLKGMLQARHMWGFTAAQSNRAGFASPLITVKDLADSFEGAMHADVVISINRDDEEAEQEKVRLYIAKDRNGVDKKIIKGYTNYRKGAFWSRKHSRSL